MRNPVAVPSFPATDFNRKIRDDARRGAPCGCPSEGVTLAIIGRTQGPPLQTHDRRQAATVPPSRTEALYGGRSQSGCRRGVKW